MTKDKNNKPEETNDETKKPKKGIDFMELLNERIEESIKEGRGKTLKEFLTDEQWEAIFGEPKPSKDKKMLQNSQGHKNRRRRHDKGKKY